MSTPHEILKKYVLDIEYTIRETLDVAPSFIHGVISYHLGWVDQNFKPLKAERGKMLRPTLCLLVFDALTGSHKDALPVAAALEMIHNFTLIHDDIEDNDFERRGRPTAWSIWGKPLAINVGDFLYTLAFSCISHLDQNKFAPENILAVQRLINHYCLDLTVGQDMDLRFEQTQDVSTEMYLDMVYKKTGALLEAAILSGATLGTSNQQIITHYRQFAQNIGIAFQVRDDILGIWGDTTKTGKSTDNDLRRKKKTLPVIYTLNKATGQRQTELRQLYAEPEPLSDTQVEFVRESLEGAGAYDYAQTMADTYIDNAFAALNKINISNQAQSDLETIARFLVHRSH
ncbi:MAG TPA: polyprenyl synthetase family protein [Anaerolineales bacterium]|nr:polyprenyl synthetase family protein [Anaerolineales bacterium]